VTHMNDTGSDITTPRQRTLADEVINRQRELRDAVLRNFEIARLNLRDTQLSPEAALIAFYEGVALSLSTIVDQGKPEPSVPNDTTADRFDLALHRFETAGKLVEFADGLLLVKGIAKSGSDDLLTKYWTVGFHARYNAIVLRHRRIEAIHVNDHKKGLKAGAFVDLIAICNQYESLYDQLGSQPFSSAGENLVGVRLAALCGRISCLCSQAQIAIDQQLLAEMTELNGKINEARTEIGELMAQARQKTPSDIDLGVLASSISASLERLCHISGAMNHTP
jgi:hypothetical protein